jgi:hypothetical protein
MRIPKKKIYSTNISLKITVKCILFYPQKVQYILPTNIFENTHLEVCAESNPPIY